MRFRGLLASLLAVTVSLAARAAVAELDAGKVAIRENRRVLVAIGVPDVLWLPGHDVTVPLPTVRLAVNLSPALALDVTAGELPYETTGLWSTVHVGIRYFFAPRPFSPYVVLRAGTWMDHANEGAGDRSYPFAALCGGVEQTWKKGLSLWAELGPALISYTDGGARSWIAGLQGSAGIGVRL
jgi:hypothetical protein